METDPGANEEELTSTMGNLLATNSEEKSDASDSTPTSSTDAFTAPLAMSSGGEDPISSTSSDVLESKRTGGLDSEVETVGEGTSSVVSKSDLLDMEIKDASTEKISENVDDIAQDLENLLGTSTSSLEFLVKPKKTAGNSAVLMDIGDFSMEYPAQEEKKKSLESTSVETQIAESKKQIIETPVETVETPPEIAQTSITPVGAVEAPREIVETPITTVETVETAPEIIETPITTVETVETAPEIIETPITTVETVETAPEIIETPITTVETVETAPEIIETPITTVETVETAPEIVETPIITVETIETPPEIVETSITPMETVETPPEIVETPLKTIESPVESVEIPLKLKEGQFETIETPSTSIEAPPETVEILPAIKEDFTKLETENKPETVEPLPEILPISPKPVSAQAEFVETPLEVPHVVLESPVFSEPVENKPEILETPIEIPEVAPESIPNSSNLETSSEAPKEVEELSEIIPILLEQPLQEDILCKPVEEIPMEINSDILVSETEPIEEIEKTVVEIIEQKHESPETTSVEIEDTKINETETHVVLETISDLLPKEPTLEQAPKVEIDTVEKEVMVLEESANKEEPMKISIAVQEAPEKSEIVETINETNSVSEALVEEKENPVSSPVKIEETLELVKPTPEIIEESTETPQIQTNTDINQELDNTVHEVPDLPLKEETIKIRTQAVLEEPIVAKIEETIQDVPEKHSQIEEQIVPELKIDILPLKETNIIEEPPVQEIQEPIITPEESTSELIDKIINTEKKGEPESTPIPDQLVDLSQSEMVNKPAELADTLISQETPKESPKEEESLAELIEKVNSPLTIENEDENIAKRPEIPEQTIVNTRTASIITQQSEVDLAVSSIMSFEPPTQTETINAIASIAPIQDSQIVDPKPIITPPKASISIEPKRRKDREDKLTEPLVIRIEDPDKERCYSPKITIKPIKPVDEEPEEREGSKGSLKMTITKQSNTMHSILKIYDADDDQQQVHSPQSELIVPKLIIKPIAHSDQHSPKTSRSSKVFSPSSSGPRSSSPRITIKPIVKPAEDYVSPIKIGKAAKHSPKLTIKPIIKPDDEGTEAKVHSPRVTIKPIVKPPEEYEQLTSPRITIKPIVKPRSESPEVSTPRVTIKPLLKPTENEKEVERSSPKITIKPIVRPQEPEEDVEEGVKERIVLKINKGTIPSTSKEEKSEKLAKIKLKFSREGGHPHIVQDDSPAVKRPRIEQEPSVTISPIGAAQNKLKEILSMKSNFIDDKVVTIDDDDDDVAIVDDRDLGKDSPIVISEESNQDSVSLSAKDPLADIPVYEITMTIPEAPVVPMPRKRGRPRKVPLQVREDFKDIKEEEPKPVVESTRPKRSCRGQSARDTLGIKPRKPRGAGRGRGSKRGMGTRSIPSPPAVKPPKEFKLNTPKVKQVKEELLALANQPKVELKTVEVEDGALKIGSHVDNSADRADIVMYEEETRMSAETSSRAQTPAKQVAIPDIVEESQSSVLSSATTESAKGRRGTRLEVQEPEGAVISADQLAEYYWSGGGPYMLQEQVAQFLGIKSFKRKYPNMPRRVVDMQERDFIRESGLAGEAMCDLGLTAVSSADILDIMYSDFQDKYEEYCKHQRDRQAKDLTNKQKALSLAASQEKSRMDIMQQAVQSAASWNTNFNKTRKDQRKACMDLQTLTVHFPKGKIKQINKPKIGNYPVALVPGQFTDYYKEFTPTEINNLPLGTLCYDAVVKNTAVEMECDSQTDGSGTESDTTTSDSDSSYSGSSDGEDCTLCKPAMKRVAV